MKIVNECWSQALALHSRWTFEVGSASRKYLFVANSNIDSFFYYIDSGLLCLAYKIARNFYLKKLIFQRDRNSPG
jgi:hypothetical protein